MTRRTLVFPAATLAIGVLLAGFGLGARAYSDPIDTASIVPELGEARSPGDAVPSSLALIDVGEGGLVGSSTRFLGADATRSFWAGVDAAGDICLVVAIADKNEFIAATCARPDSVQRSGLFLGFQSAGPEAVAYLLPDAAIAERVPAPWTRVTANLVIAPTADAAASVIIPVVGGGAIEISR